MTYSISENYSAFNNYTYTYKTSFISTLDWLSTPWRRVFGGRDVDVLSQAYGEQMSTTGRVATVFLSVLIFPVAFVSLTSLLIKLATSPYKWEKKIVQSQSITPCNAIKAFNAAVTTSHSQAIQILRDTPEIAEGRDIHHTIFETTRQKIIDHTPWKELVPLLTFLQAKSAIELINFAVMTRLNYEFELNCNLLSSQGIITFVQQSLEHASSKDIKSCYEALFSRALKIDMQEDLLKTLIKMDLANALITDCDNLENKIQASKFKLFSDNNFFSHILLDHKSMEKIHAFVTGLRNIEKISWQAVSQLDSASNQKDAWISIKPVFLHFQNKLISIMTAVDEKEKKYIAAVHMAITEMITVTEACRIASTVKEISDLTEKVRDMACLSSLENFCKTTETSSHPANVDDILAQADLKKNAALLVNTKKMHAALLKAMMKAANTIS